MARSAHLSPAGGGPSGGSPSVKAPRWSLETIYPGLQDPAFAADLERLTERIIAARTQVADTAARVGNPAQWLRDALGAIGSAYDLHETLESYCYAEFSVDTSNEAATAALNRVAEAGVPLASLAVEFRNALDGIRDQVPGILKAHDDLREFAFIVREELDLQERQLTAVEENLAADLARSGADAWSRLHETISSTLSAVWDEKTGETKTVVELRALAFDPDRAVRHAAYRKELAAWQRVETPLAFALNGVKGTTHTLNSRRGWESTLERSAVQNRLSTGALESMIDTMRESLPVFRRYLHLKARALGLPRLSFYDLFAPVGRSSSTWTFDAAIEFIADRIGAFDPEQAEFVLEARDRQWIDAEPRSGKVGGAYCTDFPRVGESRILANFDGSYDGVSTLAHELGHAWHSRQIRDLPALQRHYPMTLAETASIFSETLVFYGALDGADPDEERYLIEQFLQGSTQVIVDILSRFIFEGDLMRRRAEGELSAKDLSDMMRSAQLETYGDGLNDEELHPYMWAVKGHYYRAELAFYNFPYAFGQLFGLGLYGQYRAAPEGFARRYRDLLRETGRQDAVHVTGLMGFDIESRGFWRGAIAEIESLVNRFAELVGE